MDRSMSWSERRAHQQTRETDTKHSSIHQQVAKARSKSQDPPTRTREQRIPLKTSFIPSGPSFAWDADETIPWKPAKISLVPWIPSSALNNFLTSSPKRLQAELPNVAFGEEVMVAELGKPQPAVCVTLEEGPLPLETSNPVISQTCDEVLDSHTPPPSVVAPLALTQYCEEQDVPVPSTPTPSSNSSNGGCSVEHLPQRQHKSDNPRHFLISDKRTPPKGFKRLQNRSGTVTPDRKPAYSPGDGFSEDESIPTGLIYVGGKRKSSLPTVALGQLELTQTTMVEPVERLKRRRFMRIRRTDRTRDNTFDFSDVPLTPKITERLQQKTLNDHDTPESSPGRSTRPILGKLGMRKGGPDGSPSQACVRELLNTTGDVKTSTPCCRLPSGPAATDRKIIATMMPYEEQTTPSQMKLSVEAWGTYEVSQTPVVSETQLIVSS